MDLKQVKELIALMEKAGLRKLCIKEEKGFQLELERHIEAPAQQIVERPQHVPHFSPPVAVATAAHRHAEEVHSPKGEYVKSPLVGTFYSAPSPDDSPYVKVGDQVTEETVVGIIEAMKVMNEVKCGKRGKIAEILAENGQSVEYGTHLFRII